MAANGLTAKQQRALRAAPAPRRAAMRSGFLQQRSRRPQATTAPPRVRREAPREVLRGTPHHFDAFKPGGTGQALSFSVGPATAIKGSSYISLSHSTGSYYLLTFNAGGGAVVGTHNEHNGTSWQAATNLTIPSTGLSASGPSASSPDTFMPARGSLRIRNVTRAADVAGVVRVLRVSAGLTLTANQDTLVAYVRGHQRTRVYSGEELCTVHQWDQIPVAQDSYHAFVSPGTNVAEYETYTQDPGLSTLLVVFERSASATQDYELTFAMNAWARYNEIGPLSNAYVMPPSIPLALTNAARDAAEAVGSTGKKLAGSVADTFGGYLGAMLAQRSANAVARALPRAAPLLALTAG